MDDVVCGICCFSLPLFGIFFCISSHPSSVFNFPSMAEFRFIRRFSHISFHFFDLRILVCKLCWYLNTTSLQTLCSIRVHVYHKCLCVYLIVAWHFPGKSENAMQINSANAPNGTWKRRKKNRQKRQNDRCENRNSIENIK